MGLAAYVIGNITILTTKMDQNTLVFRSKVAEVDSYLATKEIPADLRDMAVKQLETHQDLLSETDEALQHCPPYIRNRILSHLYYKKLTKTPLLQARVSNHLLPSILSQHSTVLSFKCMTGVMVYAHHFSGVNTESLHRIIAGNIRGLCACHRARGRA
jgi:hypothetical protein